MSVELSQCVWVRSRFNGGDRRLQWTEEEMA